MVKPSCGLMERLLWSLGVFGCDGCGGDNVRSY